MRELETENERRSEVVIRLPSSIMPYVLVGAGGLCLFASVVFASTILAFIGLGLAFWGTLFLFIRPQRYVRSDLMDSTALSTLTTIDNLMNAMGYTEKGIYIPTADSEKAVVFVPRQPGTRIPTRPEIGDDVILSNPKGVVMMPPGLHLANLIERELGTEFRKIGLNDLSRRLPKTLIEDLEIVRDFDMRVDGNMVRFRFVDSVYSGFCNGLRGRTGICSSLGCPICSAMACIVAEASGKPVVFEKDEFSDDGKMLESSCRMLEA